MPCQRSVAALAILGFSLGARAQMFPHVSMHEGFEGFPLGIVTPGDPVSGLPESFDGPPGFEWGINRLSTFHVSGGAIEVVDLSSTPVAGNAGAALRIRATTGAAPDSPGPRYDLEFPRRLVADVSGPLRVSADHFTNSVAERFTFNGRSIPDHAEWSHYVVWQGACTAEDDPWVCDERRGLPAGPMNEFYTLTRTPDHTGWEVRFARTGYCLTDTGAFDSDCAQSLQGALPGQQVFAPSGSWFRLAIVSTADGRQRTFIDFRDGRGEILIFDAALAFTGALDRVGGGSHARHPGSALLVDDVRIEGPLLSPEGPARECPYLDDLDYLAIGTLLGQSPRWEPRDDGPFTQVITPEGADDRRIRLTAREGEQRTYLPMLESDPPDAMVDFDRDAQVTADLRIVAQNNTFGVFGPGGIFVLFGLHDRTQIPPTFNRRIYIVRDGDFSPWNRPSTPSSPNIVRVGIDVHDTGVDWPDDGETHTLGIRWSRNGAVRLAIDGEIVARVFGATRPGQSSRFTIDSENNPAGVGSFIEINNLTMECGLPPCATDVNIDGATNFGDINLVLSNIGVRPPPGSGSYHFLPGDVNLDIVVDFADLNAVLSAYGTSCE